MQIIKKGTQASPKQLETNGEQTRKPFPSREAAKAKRWLVRHRAGRQTRVRRCNHKQ